MSTYVHLVIESIAPPAPNTFSLLRQCRSDNPMCLGDFSDRYTGRFSYFSPAPANRITFTPNDTSDPLDLLNDTVTQYTLDDNSLLPVPFVGGWVGFLSYDLGRFIERLPHRARPDLPLPLMQFGFYDHLIAWDHQNNKGYAMALDYPGQQSDPCDRINHLKKLCSLSQNEKTLSSIPAHSFTEKMHTNITHTDYLDKVTLAREYILNGDIFEVNLSQRFSCEYSQHPYNLYHYLTQHNPASYSALLIGSDYAIVCASPELFLQKRGDNIITRPIKGTRPRDDDPARDHENYLDLINSEKDRAELNMIIDLERNDLGRFCEFGSVRVAEQRTVETLPTVFHTVAAVAGTARPNTSVADILRATFPGGSITGAPKIRAMEIIDELEPTDRSVYTGSIGWFGLNGDFDLNIAIRTIILTGHHAYVQAGGAVVADSTPQAEYEETLHKAAALIDALQNTKQKKTSQTATNTI